jgi:hypothetical protein
VKGSGKPDDRKGHVRFDVAGAGNEFTVELVMHRQTKETEQIGFAYGTPRQSSTLHIAPGASCRGSRLRLLLLDFFAFCFVHPSQTLLNSTPQLLAGDRRVLRRIENAEFKRPAVRQK